MYKLCFYVPKESLESVKTALFKAGAGQIGDYSHCCWQAKGEGQFMPIDNSNPFIGEQDKLEKVSEYKVEMVCDPQFIKATIDALLNSHPYETPAYQVIKCETDFNHS